MLFSLYIKNYALIEEITVTFDRGLSIITGETGAGKSIIMDAISIIIGERASADLIRTGETKAIVEAEFVISPSSPITQFLISNELENETGSLIIRREVNQKSAARAFVNDSPVSISVLKELGALLIDLHGQHEHQSLLFSERHVDFLDEYAEVLIARKEFGELYDRFNSFKKEYNDLLANKEKIARERDFFEFQLHEIRSVDPKLLEDESIEHELSILENSEELRDLTAEVHQLLYESEDSVHLRLSKAKVALEHLRKIDPQFEEQLQELQSSLASITELAHSLSHYQSAIELKPERLDELRKRHLALSRLKKKFGPTLNDVIATRAKLEMQLGPEHNIDEQLLAIEKKLFHLQGKTTTTAKNLSEKRKKSAKKFEQRIIEELVKLGIENGKFHVEFTLQESKEIGIAPVNIDGKNYTATKTGFDKVEFFISTNKGENPKPLVKVASGGEVSRIMLAVKTVLSAGDTIPLMIFDEIDSGISGRIAQQVGKAMKALSKKHQIMAITHLGQIAAFADAHYLVEKTSTDKATSSALRKLSKSEHEEEIARLISGSMVTGSSLEAARSLLQEAGTFVAA